MSGISLEAYQKAVIKKLEENTKIRRLVRYQEHTIDLTEAKNPIDPRTKKPKYTTTDWDAYIDAYLSFFKGSSTSKFKAEVDNKQKKITIVTQEGVTSGDIEGFIARQLGKLKKSSKVSTTVKNIAGDQSIEHLTPKAKQAGLELINDLIKALREPIVRGKEGKDVEALATLTVQKILGNAVEFSKGEAWVTQIITSKDLKENVAEGAAARKDLKKVYVQITKTLTENMRAEITTLEGSDSLPVVTRKMAANAIEQKFKQIKSKNITTKFKGNKIDRPKAKKITSFTLTKARTSKSFRSAKTGQFISGAQAQRQQVGFAQSPLQLIKALNNQLPKRVAANMGTPKLNFRTGRFASSTHITDIQQTRTGMMSIGYSYQLNPYDVFEMGRGKEPWKTPERDPRKIIDESIRELMVQYTTARFTTRRTT